MRELEQRSHDLELVRDSSLDIASSLDLPQVLESVVRRLVDALDMDACTISRVEPVAGETQLLVSYADGGFNAVADLGGAQPLEPGGIGQQVMHARRPLIVNDAEDARLNEPERQLFVARGHRTQLVLPLRTRDRVIGLIELFDDRRRRDLSADDLQMALAICRFAAVAIDNAQLYDNERETANHLELLTRQLTELQAISLALNELVGRADPQGILEHVAVAGARLLAVRCAAVVRRDSRGVRIVASFGDDGGICFDTACLEEVFAPAQSPAGSSPVAGRPAAVVAGLLVAAIDAGQVGRELALVFAGARGGTFGEEDRLLATTLAAQVSASLRNTLIFRREHEIAETFQNALRIDPWPISGLSVGVHYDPAGEAARVGGDFYDLVQLAPGRLMVAVGDVCGKGLSAAAQTAVVRYMLRAYVAEGSPGGALSRLNCALVAQDETQPFVTMLVAYVDVDRHMVEYAIAGHPRPIVLAGGTNFIVPGEGNMPVGIFANIVYPTNRVVLPDDSIVVLFTDGVIEARQNGRLLGEARLREIVRRHADLSAAELAAVIVSEVKEYAGGRLDDDALTVLLRLP
jgi:serine phosphatase RsbU (regulator of sigma subunit)